MSLPERAINNSQLTLVLLVMVGLLGLVSFYTMPRSEDPQVEFPAATVVALFPGANPADLESLVVDPLEEAIREIEDLKQVETTILNGVAVLAAEMETGTSADEAYDEVLEAINSVRGELPDAVQSVEVTKTDITDLSILQLALVSATADYHDLRTTAEDLAERLERVPGVKDAETWAYPDPEVRVALDLEKMRVLGVSIGRVADAVRSSAQNIPGGDLDLGQRRFNLRTSGDYTTLDDIRRTVVHASPAGLVYLEDLAEVQMAHADETHRARFGGTPSVFVTINQRKGTNILHVMDAVRPVVDAFAAELPEGLSVQTVFDQSESVRARVNGFFANLLQGIGLVGFVMLLALGFRAAAIVMLAIPFSILIAIAGVDLTGFGLQQMSIVGLVIALGLLVDNAIVVTENVGRFVKPGVPGREAAIQGTREVAGPVVSATATTVLAFLPMVLVQTPSANFIRSMPVTVIYALVASLIVSLVLTPLAASRFLKVPADPAQRRGLRKRLAWFTANAAEGGPLNRFLARIVAGPYARSLALAVRRPAYVLGLAVLVFAGSLALFPVVGVSLFPKAEKPQFLINVELPEGTSLDRTDAAVWFVENLLAGRDDVRRFAANVGRGNPQVYYNVAPERERSNIGQVYVELVDFREAERVVSELKAALAEYPGVRFEVVEFEQGPPVEAPVAIKVLGPDLDVLERLAGEVEALLKDTPGTENVDNPLAQPKTDLHLAINRDKAGLLGIPLIEIDQTVRAAVAGLPAATFRDNAGDQHDIVLRLQTDGRPTRRDLDRIAVPSMTGASIPLRQVAALELATVPKRIDRYNEERVVTVTSGVQRGYSELAITGAVVEALEGYDWPAGYRFFAGGAMEEQQEGFAGLLRALVLALLGIFGVLVWQFRSFTQPLIIFAAVPLAVVGAILGLLVMGYTFSFTAFVGLTSLVGIVINNSIILVDYANRLMAEGRTLTDAVTTSSRTRFIPIVLTTLTTIGGLLPLTLTGSSLWSPLGVVIISGLLASTLLTLFVVPVLYTLFTRRKAMAVSEGGLES